VTTEQKIIKAKVGLLELAKELGTPRREPLKCAQEDLSWRRRHRECNRFRSGSHYPTLK